MSYCKITTSDGKERGLKFNNYAFAIYEKKSEPGILITFGYALFYGGLRGWSYVKEQEPDYTFEQACEWYDELTPEQGDVITAAFKETQVYKNSDAYKKEQEQEAAKKNEMTTQEVIQTV